MFPSYKYNFRHTGSRHRVAVQCFNSTQNIQILQKLTRDLSLVWKRFMPTTTSDKKVIVKTRIGKMILQNFGNIKHETTRVFQILGGSQIILILLFDPRSTPHQPRIADAENSWNEDKWWIKSIQFFSDWPLNPD